MPSTVAGAPYRSARAQGGTCRIRSRHARSGRDRIRHVDVYGAFKANQPTKAYPVPKWFTGGAFDLATIGRDGDTLHPRRLPSIDTGEVVADSFDLVELTGL